MIAINSLLNRYCAMNTVMSVEYTGSNPLYGVNRIHTIPLYNTPSLTVCVKDLINAYALMTT